MLKVPIDVYSNVQNIRNQRLLMVQVEDQYIFIHNVLLEALNSGDTEIQVEDFPDRLKELMDANPHTGTLLCLLVLTVYDLVAYREKVFQNFKTKRKYDIYSICFYFQERVEWKKNFSVLVEVSFHPQISKGPT